MKLIIDIQNECYDWVKNGFPDEEDLRYLVDVIKNGTVLPDNVIVLSKEVADRMFPPYYKYENGIVKENKE